MKKSKYSTLAILLGTVILLPSCTHPSESSSSPFSSEPTYRPGSDDNGSGETDSSFVPYQGDGQVLDTNSPHVVEGTIHQFNSKESSTIFCEPSKTCYYTVVMDTDNLGATDAATFFASQVEQGCKVSVTRVALADYTYDASKKCIYFGCDSLYAAAGFSAPTTNIGISGYYIQSLGDSAFVGAKSTDAYNLAVLRLLEDLIGYDCLMYQHYVYSKAESGNPLPFYDFDIVEVPDFKARLAPGWADASLRYAQGLTNSPYPTYNAADYTPVHNVYYMMRKYQEEHPDWFDAKGASDPGTGATVYQLCYSARGDQDSYKAMVQAAADEIIAVMVKNPDNHAITFTQMDTLQYCDCDACSAKLNTYGTTSAVQIQFLNDVDNTVQSYIHNPERTNTNVIPTDFEYTILMFAYHDTMKAPAKYDAATDTWSPIDESVRCHPTVGVILAPSYALYTHSFYEEENKAVYDQIRGWSSCASYLFAWTYSNNFRGYTFPYNSFDAMVENARFLKSNNTQVLYDSCSWESPMLPGFMELKKYLNSKLAVNVNIDPVYYTKKWFHDIYRDAADTMYRLYRFERAYCQSIESSYTGTINDYQTFEDKTLWPTGLMLKWQNLCEEAMKEIEAIKDTDYYENCYTAILLESIMPRYVMLQLHPDYYGGDELLALRKAFRNDIETLGITYIKEHAEGNVDVLWQSWGI